MKAISRLKGVVPIIIVLFILGSCNLLNSEEFDSKEVEKSIEGTWYIIQVTRNEADITSKMDFSKFRIHFNEDLTYTMENYVPFIVTEDGIYSLDDPYYPFTLTFKEGDSNDILDTELYYPVVDGVRQIYLTFSPGCFQNTYTYILEREEQ